MWYRIYFITLNLIILITSAIGILQYFFQLNINPLFPPASATFGNRNFASHFVTFLFPLVFIPQLFSKSKRLEWTNTVIQLFTALIVLIFIYITKTRNSWLALTVSVLFFTVNYIILLLKNKKLKKIYISNLRRQKYIYAFFLILIIGTALFSLVILGNNNNQKFNFSQKALSIQNKKFLNTGSLNVRFKLWQNSLAMIKQKWFFGYGINNFKIFYPRFHRSNVIDSGFNEYHQPQNIHNDFLQKFVEIGIIGFISYLLIVLSMLYLIIKNIHFIKNIKTNIYSLHIGTSIIAFFCLSLFSFPMFCTLISLVFFMLCAVLFNLTLGKNDKSINIYKNKTIKYLSVIFLILIYMFLSKENYEILMSHYLYKETLKYINEKNYEKTISSGLQSYQITPGFIEVLRPVAYGFLKQKKYDLAIFYLKKIQKIYKYDIKTLKMLKNAYDLKKDYKNADIIKHQLIHLIPDNIK